MSFGRRSGAAWGLTLGILVGACGAETGLISGEGGAPARDASAGDSCTLLSEALHSCGTAMASDVTECDRELAVLDTTGHADVAAVVDCIRSFGRACSTIDRFHGRCQSQQGQLALDLPMDSGFTDLACVTMASCAGSTCTCTRSDGSSRICTSDSTLPNCCTASGIPTCFFGSF